MIGVTVVFGFEFLRLFCQTTLESLSAKGNFGSPNCAIREWYIFTTEHGKQTITQTKKFREIFRNTKILFFPLDENIAPEKKYSIMTFGHNFALKEGLKKNLGVVFIQPDAIYFDGIFDFINSRKQFSAIFVPSFMVIREKFQEAFANENNNFSLEKINEVSKTNLHRFTLDHEISFKKFRNDCPNFFFTKINEFKILFHPTPFGLIYLNPQMLKKIEILTTYDSDLLENFEEKIENVYFENNLRKCVWPEMSPASRFEERVSNEPINFCWVLHAWRTEKHFGGIKLKQKFLSQKAYLFLGKETADDIKAERIMCRITEYFKYALKNNLFTKIANISNYPNSKYRKFINNLFLSVLESKKLKTFHHLKFFIFLRICKLLNTTK